MSSRMRRAVRLFLATLSLSALSLTACDPKPHACNGVMLPLNPVLKAAFTLDADHSYVCSRPDDVKRYASAAEQIVAMREKAAGIQPKDPTLKEHMATIVEQLGEWEAAMREGQEICASPGAREGLVDTIHRGTGAVRAIDTAVMSMNEYCTGTKEAIRLR